MATLFRPTEISDDHALIAYQPAEDSLTRRCASSYTISSGTFGDGGSVNQFLARGWPVVVSDYEGPDAEWTAGVQAGHAVLDAIRAARHFHRLGLPRRPRVGMVGYSGGGQATNWAAELEHRYAPRLGIDGAVAGGTPVDMALTARSVDGHLFAGAYFGSAVGLSRAYP